MKVIERYASAVRSTNLTVDERTTRSDSDGRTNSMQPDLAGVPASMAPARPQAPLVSVRERILQAVVELHLAGRAATRQVLGETTDFSYAVIDDHVKRMIGDGVLRRISHGVFEPVEVLPAARAVSVTKLPNGMCKLEVGDFCIDLHPAEERAIGRFLSGSATEMAGIQNGREILDTVAELRRQLQEERRLREIQDEVIRKLQGIPRQDELALG